jgi:hypothetical protein
VWTEPRTRRPRPVRVARSLAPLAIALALALGIGAYVIDRVAPAGSGSAVGPSSQDYVAFDTLPRTKSGASGLVVPSYTEECGRNEEGHRNADNVVVSPGYTNGAHHAHDYVGNLSTDAFSTNTSLAAARTTCRDGDRSTYYWPVLRRQDRPTTTKGGGGDATIHGNIGRIIDPVSVTVEYRGNPVSDVVPMPRFLRMITGDPVAGTQGDANAHAQWGCSTAPGSFTPLYPRCPQGARLMRTLDFPSCWNGLDTDSPDHRTHIVFPAANGACPHGTFAVPQLRITLTYDVDPDSPFALDAFSEQRHSPKTDHALFIDVMTDSQMAAVVRCINARKQCVT